MIPWQGTKYWKKTFSDDKPIEQKGGFLLIFLELFRSLLGLKLFESKHPNHYLTSTLTSAFHRFKILF
jgi:hypothetical protein